MAEDPSLPPAVLELAELSQAVYTPEITQIGKWTRVPDTELSAKAINPASLRDETFSLFDNRTDFKAGLYKSSEDEYVLAFAGSESAKDWYGNLKQALGFEAGQYRQAVALSKDVLLGLGKEFTLAGHSLGGGLAALASAVTNMRAVTFNPAGVHDKTLRRHGIDPKLFRAHAQSGQIENHVLEGEILDRVQKFSAFPDTLGQTVNVEYTSKEYLGPGARHRIGSVIKTLDASSEPPNTQSAPTITETIIARAQTRAEPGGARAALREAVTQGALQGDLIGIAGSRELGRAYVRNPELARELRSAQIARDTALTVLSAYTNNPKDITVLGPAYASLKTNPYTAPLLTAFAHDHPGFIQALGAQNHLPGHTSKTEHLPRLSRGQIDAGATDPEVLRAETSALQKALSPVYHAPNNAFKIIQTLALKGDMDARAIAARVRTQPLTLGAMHALKKSGWFNKRAVENSERDAHDLQNALKTYVRAVQARQAKINQSEDKIQNALRGGIPAPSPALTKRLAGPRAQTKESQAADLKIEQECDNLITKMRNHQKLLAFDPAHTKTLTTQIRSLSQAAKKARASILGLKNSGPGMAP